MYIIVGLGNPGSRYAYSRHNVGFQVIDDLGQMLNIKVNKLKWKALYGEGRIGNERVLLVKPQTFMNNSGESVRDIVNFYKVAPENLIVLVDDIDIAFGTIRIKGKGSAGSHNGMKSIIQLLGYDTFPRIKVSVGEKPDYMDLADFVLSGFRKDEIKVINAQIDAAKEAVVDIVQHGITYAMNAYNAQNFL